MYCYIYELLQAPVPEEKWTTEWDISEHPDAFPIADWVNTAEDREDAIAHFGAWLEQNRLGRYTDGAFSVDAEAADRYFEGRFSKFQQAVRILQQLDEMQFIHEHDWVQQLIDQLGQLFTYKNGDYVLWNNNTPIPFEEFLRKAQPSQRYYFGAVLTYK